MKVVVFRGRSTNQISADALRLWPHAEIVVCAAENDPLRCAGDRSPAQVVTSLLWGGVVVANGGRTAPMVGVVTRLTAEVQMEVRVVDLQPEGLEELAVLKPQHCECDCGCGESAAIHLSSVGCLRRVAV